MGKKKRRKRKQAARRERMLRLAADILTAIISTAVATLLTKLLQ